MAGQPKIHELLIEIMRAVTHVGKEQRNREQKFDFRGVDDVVGAIGPKLREFGVLCVPRVTSSSRRDTETSRGKATRETIVKVDYRFIGPAGDDLIVTVEGESLDVGDKGTAKAMSVAWRIALIQAFSLPTDEPDPDLDTYDRGGRSGRRRDRVNARDEESYGGSDERDDDERDQRVDDDPDDEDRERELAILRRKCRELGIDKEDAADVYERIFGEDLRTGDPAKIEKFTGHIIAFNELPRPTEKTDQHPQVRQIRDETRAETDRERDEGA